MSAAPAAAAAAIAQAIKASGVLVRLEPSEFLRLLAMNEDPLVVYAPPRGLFSRRHRYLMGFHGLAFYCASAEELSLGGVGVVLVRSIWIPG